MPTHPEWGRLAACGGLVGRLPRVALPLEIGLLVGQASRPARVLQNPLFGERSPPALAECQRGRLKSLRHQAAQHVPEGRRMAPPYRLTIGDL
jgi:hypothetical protein